MTQEEKAKLYDEALKYARIYYTNGNEDMKMMMKTCFPVLVEESEDERIKHEIKVVLANTELSQFALEYTFADMLAWLEKQKTKKNEWLFEKGKWYVKLQHHYEGDLRHFEKGHVYQAVSEVKITDGYHNVSLSSWEIPEYFRPATKDEIPKETEQTSKLDEDDNIRNYFINAVKEQPNIHQEWKEKCLNWLEKQDGKPQKTSIWKHWKNGIAGNGEGKPIYLIKYGYTYSISSCLCFECDYIELSELEKMLSEKQGEQKPLTIDIKSMVDSYEQRLIKNGGVSNSPLVNMCVAAFRHGVENTLDELHLKQILANSCETCKDEQKPFDYENANIHQKDFAPKADMPRYSIGDVLCDKSCTMLGKEEQSNFEITDIRNGMYICDKCSFPISQQDEYELVAKRIEQKPAWSEEDNKHYQSCLNYFEEIKPDSVFYKDYLWLKSLKERIKQ